MLHAHLLLSVLFISNNDLNLTENRWWLINMQLVKWRHLLWERLPCSPYISMSPWLTVFWIAFERIWIQVSTWFNSSLFILPLGSFPPSFCMFIAVSTLVIFTPMCDIRNWASKAENPGWNTQQIHTSPSVQNIYKREPHYAGPICDFPGFDDRHIHGIFRMHATYIRALWHLLFCLSRRTKPFLTLSGCNLKCLERILRVITLLQRARPPRI